MVAPPILVVVALAQDAAAQWLGPGGPGRALPLDGRAEARVVLSQRSLRQEVSKALAAVAAVGEEAARDRLQHATLQGSETAVVDVRLRTEGSPLRLEVGRGEPRPRGCAAGAVGGLCHVEIQLVPEQATGGRVGT